MKPGGGIPRPIIGGGIPRPMKAGFGIPRPIGGPLAIIGPDCAATEPIGCIMPGAGPPIPRIGPAKPVGAAREPGTIPLPAITPRPGPAPATLCFVPAEGGGPSTVNDTTFSPRKSTSPRVRFSCRSSTAKAGVFLATCLLLIVRNSSQSPRTRFMCLSKAMNVPTSVRLSCIVTLIL